MYVCMYVCMYVFMYVYMYVRMYVCMYVCIYVCMYVMYTEVYQLGSSHQTTLKYATFWQIVAKLTSLWWRMRNNGKKYFRERLLSKRYVLIVITVHPVFV